jgi:galactose mutarotase-like enzyme
MGAQLFTLKDAEGRDLQWDGDPAIWSGRAPILFPIVGALADDRYRVDGKTYDLSKHGFARRSLFVVVEATSSSAAFRLRESEETLTLYPFRFELDVRFTVEDATLTLTATVKNPGDAPLPASFGFHPALRWPLPYGAPRAEHRLTFACEEPAPIRRIDTDGVVLPESFKTPVVGRELALRDDLFTDDAVIFDALKSDRLRYGADTGPSLEIAFPDTPYLGVWTKPGAGYICIEPWHGIADPVGFDGDFRTKPGVFEVPPGGAKEIAMSITLQG